MKTCDHFGVKPGDYVRDERRVRQTDTERAVGDALFGAMALALAGVVWAMCAARDVRDGWRRRWG